MDQKVIEFFKRHRFPIEKAGIRSVNCLNIDNETPLIIAAKLGNLEMVNKLIGLKADINMQDHIAIDKGGATPLLRAAQHGQLAIVEALLRSGAKTDITDNQGGTPIYRAAQNGHGKVIDALINAGGSPDTTCRGIPPILMAILGKHTSAILALTKGGADLKKEVMGFRSAIDLVFSNPAFGTGHHLLITDLLTNYAQQLIETLAKDFNNKLDINQMLRSELRSFSGNDEIRISILDKIAEQIISLYWEKA